MLVLASITGVLFSLPRHCALVYLCLPPPPPTTTTPLGGTEPSDISPNVYNFLADAYHDAECMDPTGDADIVSAEAFTSSALRGDGSCRRMEGSGFGLSECLADGSLVWQTFGSDDDVCTGEVFDERVFWSAEASSACRAVKINGLYYK